MNGTWKENIGGWNGKDTRRKKQTRNHTLNDKGYYFAMHEEDNKSVRIEGEVEHTEDTAIKHGETKRIFLVKILKWFWMGEYHYSHRKAYAEGRNYYKTWYDAYTGEVIDWPSKKVLIVKELWTEYIHYDEPKTYSSGYRSCGRWGGTNELTFVYDKPIYDYKRCLLYTSPSPRD